MSPLSSLRQRLMNAGSDERQIEMLRLVLAGSEDHKKLKAVCLCVEELRETCADRFLDPIAELKDRVHEKLARLGVSLPVRRAPPPDGRVVSSPAIKTKITPWREDASGILTRFVFNSADAPPS